MLTLWGASLNHTLLCASLASTRPERAETPSPGHRPGLLWTQPCRPVRAKALKNRVFTRLLPLQGALLIAIIPRAMPWARSFWAFSPYLSHMRKFSKAKVMRCFCRRETFQGYPSLLAMPIAHSGISFTYSLNILPSVILKRS